MEYEGVIWLGLAVVYFIPGVVALIRNHHNAGAIFATNLLLGWTALGWLIAFIWACTAVRHEA